MYIFIVHHYLKSYSQTNFDLIMWLLYTQSTSQKDYAVCLIPTPPEEGDEDEGDEAEGQRSKLAMKLQHVSEHWVAEHARQVFIHV